MNAPNYSRNLKTIDCKSRIESTRKTIRELTTYSYKTDPLTDRILPVLEDKNNHIMDALRYACEGIRNVRKKKEPKRTGYVSSGSWM